MLARIAVISLALLLAHTSGNSVAKADGDAATQKRVRERERIYGSELMTHAERERYRQQLANTRNAEQRDSLRANHEQRMRDRARQHGVPLQGTAASAR